MSSPHGVVFGPGAPLCATAVWNGLAFSAYQTWALRRAELTAYVESPFHGADGERATMAPIRTLPPQSFGIDRMVAIGTQLVEDLTPALRALPTTARIGLVLCLPERMADDGPRAFRHQRQGLERALISALETRGLAVVPSTIARGHASLGFAVIEAGAALSGRHLDAVVVGGIDTYYDPAVIEALIDEKRLYDGTNLDAFIPGEGGALLLLARRDVAKRCAWPAQVSVEVAATNREPSTLWNDVPCMGLGLSRAGRAIADRLQAERRTLDWWITDLTPENRRVHELSLAWPRVGQGVFPSQVAFDSLYQHLGDLGAAAMPTGVAIAAEGMARCDPAARTCLVTGSSNTEDRAAILVAQPGQVSSFA